MADYATLVYDIDSTAARSAATDLAKMNAAAVTASGGADKLNKTLRDQQGRFRSAADVTEQYGNEVRNLAAKYNPVLSAVYQYQQAQVELNRAVMLGVVTQQQAEASLATMAAGMARAATAAKGLGAAQQVGAHHTANVFANLNDIGVMLAAGQNPFQLALQQGTQLNQVWANMGAQGKSLGGVVGVLGSALGSMLNPMSLLTLGVIAGGAALVQWAMSAGSAGDKTKTFDDSVASAESAISNLSNAVETLAGARLGGLADGYGVVNAALLVHLERLKQVAELEAMASNRNNIIEAQSAMTGGWITTDLDDIRNALGTTNDAARQFIFLLDQVKAARTFESQAAAITKAREYLNGLGITLEDSEGSALLLLTQLIKAEDSAFKLKAAADGSANAIANATSQTSAWASAMSSVLSYTNAIGRTLSSLGGGAINLAAIRTETDLLKQGKSLRDASFAAAQKTNELEGKARTLELKKYGVAGEFLATLQNNQKTAILTAQQELDLARETAREREKAAAGGGGGAGKAAAEQKAAEKGFQSLQELMQKESLFQVAEYQKRQAQLDTALAQKLLSEQNYQTMKSQLATLYFGTEFEKQAVNYQMEQQQLDVALANKQISEQRHAEEISRIRAMQQTDTLSGYSTLFGNMAGIVQAGGDKTNAAYKAFAIAQGLIAARLSFLQVLADPSLIGRPFLRTALAYSTMAAGLAQVASIGGGGGGGGRGGSAAGTATAAAKAEPTKNILVRLEGPDFMVDMAEQIMQQIYDQSKDGRVIIARDRS